MLFRTGSILLTFVASICVAAEPASLTPDQLAKAVKSDTLTLPTLGELFAALTKQK